MKQRIGEFQSNNKTSCNRYLALASVDLGVLALPVLGAGSSLGLGELVSLAQSTGLATSGGEATHLAMLVDRSADPVELCVSADGLVLGVNKDDLEELVGGILGDPVRGKHTEGSAALSDTSLGNSLVAADVLQLVDSVSLGLTVGLTLGDGALATSTANADAVHDESLLGAVSETTGLLGAGGSVDAVDSGELSVLPHTHTLEVSGDLRLLFAPDLLHVL
ncbi:hypothetical protein PFISCL1PPCAC_17246, partial [Pristionchus fissidentatus]